MDFQLNIKNIGKLADAKIRIGQFTVLAGPNNTGKSTVSKLLYSLFDAMNANHAEVYLQNLTGPVRASLRGLRFIARTEITGRDVFYSLLKEIEDMGTPSRGSIIEGIEELDKAIPNFIDKVERMQKKLPDINTLVESVRRRQNFRYSPDRMKDLLKSAKQDMIKLYEELNEISAKECIEYGIKYKVKDNLVQNFQVQNLIDLRSFENVVSMIDIENFGKFELKDEEIGFSIDHADLLELQQYSNVIYLESPVYWKLKNVLGELHVNSMYRYRERVQLSGIPGYFYDLASVLNRKYNNDIAFQSLYERLVGEDVLGGKITISESGDLLFQENGRSFSLPVTAMGVVNLGILALLIERQVLDKNSILFIDEPEAHLHPAWQVIMAETLFELAKGGVTIVIATHSADILKWLEVHVKKNPEDESLIALNKFPANGHDSNKQDFKGQIAAIKRELTKPFADLYTAGL